MAIQSYGIRLEQKKHRVLIVGRGREADLRLANRTVSRLHLELVLGAGGEIHVADRSSRNGTRMWSDGRWKPLTATPVSLSDRLQLGDLEITVADLLQRALPDRVDDGRGIDRAADPDPDPDLPHGKVRRHPETGKVIPA